MKNEDAFKRLDELLQSLKYEELNSADKEWVDISIGKDAYQRLSQFQQKLQAESSMEVDPSVKETLMARMKAKEEVGKSLFNTSIPVYWVAASWIVVFIISWLLIPGKEIPVERIVMSEPQVVTDTVFVASQPDTVFVDRYIEKKIYLTRTVEKPMEEEKSETRMVTQKSLNQLDDIKSLLVKSD